MRRRSVHNAIDRPTQQWFDDVLEDVLADLPSDIIDLLDEVPLVVEDHPGPELLRQLGIRAPAFLCGLHSGIPLTQRSVLQSSTLPETITIFRTGILRAAEDRSGRVGRDALEQQIRVTVLHEVGHHFGLDEAALRRLGYG